MARTLKRLGRFLDRALQDIDQGVISGFDRLWYG
jgi:hypothetical protein